MAVRRHTELGDKLFFLEFENLVGFGLGVRDWLRSGFVVLGEGKLRTCQAFGLSAKGAFRYFFFLGPPHSEASLACVLALAQELSSLWGVC